MNVLDLFSGIGGFSLGLERAGMRTVAFCEIEPYCRAVLRKHWPTVPIFDDVRAIDAGRLGGLGRIDVVCGGFPCQPFSVAGKKAAHADDRYLWPAMREVIALARPAWVIGENVTGIVTLALDDVLADLESIGYASRPFVIPACAVGAPHRRDRVWIVATHADSSKLREQSGWSDGPLGADPAELGNDGATESLADADRDREQQPRRTDREIRQWTRDSSADVADASRELPHRDGRSGARRRTESSDSCWWSTEPDVGRVAHGIPARSQRLRALGNAVVPQVVEEIGRAIMRCAK